MPLLRMSYDLAGMKFFRHSPSERSRWRILLALICVVLVVATATVEMTHSHADGAHANCALCATAHVVIQTAAIAALIIFFAFAAEVKRTEQVLPCARATIFALYIRPPPAGFAAA